MRLTTTEVARATNGEVFGRDTTVDGASIDSRTIEPGRLFVPVVAERDGHDFIAAAVGAGAAAYLTAGPIEAGTAVLVDDTTQALGRLGSLARTRLEGHVVGVTGSVGKTSLKDLLGAVAATTWPTHVARGSFNNELGVPITLLDAPDGTGFTVVEMGARGQGHLAQLCEVARPTVGVVTVVAGAHLEQFGSLDTVAAAKGELVEALAPEGLAVLNHDDARVAAMAGRTRATVVTFGRYGGDVSARSLSLGPDLRATFELVSPWGSTTVCLGVAGEHQVTNALGAAAVALGLGAQLEAVAAGLEGAALSKGRMHLRVAADGLRVLDDSYNANPTSMAAGLRALAALPARRRVAILGTMAELGADAEAAHLEVAALARDLGVETVAVAEPRYGPAVRGELSHVSDPAQVAEAAGLSGDGRGGDVAVLVKASRSARLERVVELLLTPGT